MRRPARACRHSLNRLPSPWRRPASARSPSIGAALGGEATLLVDAIRELLVVGLERLAEVAVCEVHESDPFERCGAGVPAA